VRVQTGITGSGNDSLRGNCEYNNETQIITPQKYV